ncbi:MAG: ArsR family transcriptional regulator [Thaumarchaeota archaeon]|nr:ArsR family transcriptional regulator [Nitrososphaerota archaeon]
MRERELDTVLQVIENPVRRMIIKRLSEEACYPLQLSKELGLGQPLVAKHLAMMQKAGIVSSATESSPSGPARKRYSLAKSISITMDVAPHLFKERAISFNATPKARPTAKQASFASEARQALALTSEAARLSTISRIMDEIDQKIGAIDEERVGLLSVRNDLMDEASKIVLALGDIDVRRVAFHILEEHDREVENISRSLDMREAVVRSILDELQRELFGRG